MKQHLTVKAAHHEEPIPKHLWAPRPLHEAKMPKRSSAYARPMAAPPKSVWCLVGNGGMDPHSSLYIIPDSGPHNPFPAFPHSLLSTRQELWHDLRTQKAQYPLTKEYTLNNRGAWILWFKVYYLIKGYWALCRGPSEIHGKVSTRRTVEARFSKLNNQQWEWQM